MMEFKNCISPRIVYLNEPLETLVEHLIPPPELHIFIGITSMFVKILIILCLEVTSQIILCTSQIILCLEVTTELVWMVTTHRDF